MQYVVEIGSVLAKRVEQREAVDLRCVHMDGCCGYRMALVGIRWGIFSLLHKHSKKVLFSTCRGYISVGVSLDAHLVVNSFPY